MGARPRAENFEDQPGPVDNLRLPAPFEIALLYRAQRAVDDDDPDLFVVDQFTNVFERPASEQAARPRTRDARDLGADDIQADRPRKTDRFFQSSFDRTSRCFCRLSAERRLRRRMHDKRATGRGAVRDRFRLWAAQDSAFSLLGSNSWIGCPGITVDIACL